MAFDNAEHGRAQQCFTASVKLAAEANDPAMAADLNLGARRPRDNPAWPPVGIFGHRNMRRLNWPLRTTPPHAEPQVTVAATVGALRQRSRVTA